MRFFASLASAILIVLFAPQAQAEMLTPAYEAQLEAWLGQGDLSFTRIFAKTPGATAADFHLAADGMGPTFTLIELLETRGNAPATIGGYNPESWSTIGDWNYTPDDKDRSSFLYNLTNGVIQRQNLEPDPTGVYQAYNVSTYGPTFGGGADIYVDLNLSSGSAFHYSYGASSATNIYLNGQATQGDYGALEVYTFKQVTETPEPATLTLAAIGGFCVFGWKRRLKLAVNRDSSAP